MYRRFAVLLVVVFLLQGCGAYWATRKGNESARKTEWDEAVAHYTIALKKKPDNIGYKITLENARIQASRAHHETGRNHLIAEKLEEAEEELKIASNYDPSNRAASDDLAIARKRIEAREAEKAKRSDFDEMRRKATAGRFPMATLSPRSVSPIILKFPETSLEKILRSLGTLAGVNVLFDPDFKSTTKASVDLQNVTFEQALDQITRTNKLFYKVIDQNTLMIAVDSPAKRKTYDELVLRTFYLQFAEAADVMNAAKTLSGIQKMQAIKEIRAITAVGTPDRMAIAEKVIESLDKPKGEVVVEVKILEVNKNKLKEYGLKLSAYSAGIAYDPFGTNDPESTSGLTNVRAHLLSSLNLADFVVSIPTSLLATFLQTDDNIRILAAPRLRAAEGKPTVFKAGEETPVPIASFSPYVGGGGGGYSGSTMQVNYKNVGVMMSLEPKVGPSGDVELQLEVEFSLPGGDKTFSDKSSYPIFKTRSIKGLVRVKDGETTLLSGLLQDSEKATFTGIFGLQSVPILNRIFTQTRIDHTAQEILISITPHIVRGPRLGPEDLGAIAVGTEEQPRVPGARPPLFGPPETEAKANPARQPTGPRGGATAPSPQRPPVPGGPESARPPSAAPIESTPPMDSLGTDATPGRATETPSSAPVLPPASQPSDVDRSDGGGGLPLTPGSSVPGESPGAERTTGPIRALLSPAEVRVKVGETTLVSVVLTGAQDMRSIALAIGWTPGSIEATDVTPGALLTLDSSAIGSERSSEISRITARFTRPTGTSGSGVVANVAVRGIRPGTAELRLESLVAGLASGEVRAAVPGPVRVEVLP